MEFLEKRLDDQEQYWRGSYLLVNSMMESGEENDCDSDSKKIISTLSKEMRFVMI